MQAERRALYNSLRLHWILDPTLEVDKWQVEDYRKLSIESLFDLLRQNEIQVDRNSFIAYAENFETPEDLSDHLVTDLDLEIESQDQIYLLVFELWRRLVPEKRCLTIFCDELDYQITLYDLDQLDVLEPLEDSLANLKQILDENADEGVNPQEVFASICNNCANDVASFLYDFTSEQIEHGNLSYAKELFDDFNQYAHDLKRYEFLAIRLQAPIDPEDSNLRLIKLIRKNASDPDIDFHFDVLAFLVQEGEKDLFLIESQNVLSQITTEDDFQDLLRLCADYYHCLDRESEEQVVNQMLNERSKLPEEAFLTKNDPHIASLKKLLQKPKAI